MKSIPLDQLATKLDDETMEEFIESIPDGHAVSIQAAIDESGLSSRNRWREVAGDRLLNRYHNNKPCEYLVNRKTRNQLVDE